MLKQCLAILGACLALLFTPAHAHQAVYTALLSGPAENPPNASPGSGWVRVTVDFDLITMRIESSFAGLIGNTTAAHIHCCIDAPGNIGVAVLAPSLTGFPLGVTAGDYDQSFDMTLASSYTAGFITNFGGGTVSGAFNALVAGFDNGRAYFNIHSSSFPGGEIRGFLTPVPEPAAAALLVGGLGLLGLALRRRRPAAA